MHIIREYAAMKTLALIAAATAIATTTAGSAFAYDREARIDIRQDKQEYRIRHDRRIGQLTLLEKWQLQAEQRRIGRLERAAERDGYISRREANRISAEQDKASYDIYRLSHNGRQAWWRTW
jgi:hypothetical protein